MHTPRIPTVDELGELIRACREEMAALKKLLRMVKAAEQADAARSKRCNLRTEAPIHA